MDGSGLVFSPTNHGPKKFEVLIDAYDALNRVPAPLWKDDGPLVKALPSLLQKRAVLAATRNETKPPKSDVFFVVRKGWGILTFN